MKYKRLNLLGKSNPHIPILDDITKQASSMALSATEHDRIKEPFRCGCNFPAANGLFLVDDKYIIDSLFVHVVTCHRQDVPEKILDIIAHHKAKVSKVIEYQIQYYEDFQTPECPKRVNANSLVWQVKDKPSLLIPRREH